jgi:hypothetical protein
MLDSPPEHLNDEWFTEEELEIKSRCHNRDENLERPLKKYILASVNHPMSDSASTEAQSQETRSQTPSPNSVIYDSTLGDSTPCASNRFVPTTSIEGANASTQGSLPSPTGPQLRRSTSSTAGKFQ